MNETISHTDPRNFAGIKCTGNSLICRDKTVIFGDVTIGSDCVVHPAANIIAKAGPIVIGNSNLIEERATIINNRQEPLIIGDHNVFEVDSYCEAYRIGDNNILECKSSVNERIELTNNCIIGAGCKLLLDESRENDEFIDRFENNTVISGADLSRRVVKDLAPGSYNSQLDFLKKFLANYQKLWHPPSGQVGTPNR